MSNGRRLLPGSRPGLAQLLAYERSWLAYDVVAGVSVAAVAVPTAIAYAQIMGFDPVTGLYSSILPVAAYSLFGTSRHLIMNPDAATCALVGATLAPLAAGGADALPALAAALAIFTGLVCILAGFFRLGFVADFLSRPILVGFLNGVAIHIFLGQIGKVFGFPMKSAPDHSQPDRIHWEAAPNASADAGSGVVHNRHSDREQALPAALAWAVAGGGVFRRAR